MTVHQAEPYGSAPSGVATAPAAGTGSAPASELPRPLAREECTRISIAEQHELFTRFSPRGAWETTHIPLSEIGGFQNRERQTSFQEQSWERIPSLSFRYFQQLFSTPDQFVVPGNPALLQRDSVPQFPLKFMNPDWYSVFGCQVSPDRLSDTLIERLKLPVPDFSRAAAGLDPYAPTILGLKYLWETLRPLPQENHRHPNCRVLVVSDATPGVKARYHEAAEALGITLNSDLKGALIYLKGEHSGQEPSNHGIFRSLQLQYFSSAYNAVRKTYHEQNSYSAEQRALGPLFVRWQDFRQNQLPRWISVRQEQGQIEAADSAEGRTEISQRVQRSNQAVVSTFRALLVDSLKLLERSTNSEKKLIAERVSEMLNRLDERQDQRINPNPAVLRIASNQALLLLRSEEIDAKSMFNAQDQFLLTRTLERHEAAIEAVRERLEQSAGRLYEKRRLFTSSRLSQKEIYLETSRVLRDLDLPIDALRSFCIEPCLSFSRQLLSGFSQLNTALLAGNRDFAEDALHHLHAITLAHKSHKDIQSAMKSLSEPEIDPATMQKHIQILRQNENPRRLFAQPALFEVESTPADTQRIEASAKNAAHLAAGHIETASAEPKFPREELKQSLRDLVKDLLQDVRQRITLH